LEDDRSPEDSWLKGFIKTLKLSYENLFKSPGKPITKEFYSQPTIKYLARSDFFSKPSYIVPQNFSKTMMEIFRKYGKGKTDLEKIENILKEEVEFKSEYLKAFKNLVDPYFKEDGVFDESKVNKENVDEILGNIKELNNTKIKDSVFEQRVNLDIGKLLKGIQKKISKADDDKKVNQVASLLKRASRYLKLFEAETRSHISSLLLDSNNDVAKFRLHLENWFDETMNRATGWYKQKIQVLLLVIGLSLAAWFNASTLEMIHALSVDKKSRDQMVQMATTYTEHHADFVKVDSLGATAQLDSLEKVRRQVQRDMNAANSLLGLGWEYPDKLDVYPEDILRDPALKKRKDDYVIVALKDGKKGVVILPEGIDKRKFFQLIRASDDGFNSIKYGMSNLRKWLKDEPEDEAWVLAFENNEKVYLSEWKMFYRNIFGYLLTALAISLGAPFWFDMLNKLIQIRGSVQQPVQQASTGSGTGSSSDPAHPLNRKG